MNQELADIHREDQQDRKDQLWLRDEKLMQARDAARLKRVREIADEGGLSSSEDFYHAAMVFQHSGIAELYWKASEFAKKAADLGFDPEEALWLHAAATDRALMTEGKPQKYGTQVKKDSADGEWYVYSVDPSVTDDERKKLHVRPLAASYERAADLNKEDAERRKAAST